MALSMKNLNCDMYQMSIEFNEAQFKKKEFILDINPKNKKQTAFVFHYGSKNKSRKEHAHFFLGFDGEDSILRMSYHPGAADKEDVRAPYLEDASKWLAEFFEEKNLKVTIVVVFEYGKQYKSLIQINYPLFIGNDLYNDTKIIGHDIDFPDESIIDRASITSNKDILRIFLFSRADMDLSKFNFHSEIEKLSKYATALVKRQGE
jgi:hypothetical protein